LVFGLVAGLVFSGVSYGLGNALGTNSASSDSGIATNTVSTVSTSGEASDLVDVSSIVDAVMPSIVAVTNFSTVTTSSMFGTYSYESESLGSGIIIAQTDDYLYICTNNHVVSGAETLTVQFVDDSTVSAEITGTDAADDLAVIQVAISSISSDTLAAISIAQVDDSGDLAVGEATIAIGNSLGYGQSVTTGVISALGRTISVSDETTGETTVCTNLIQTDAAINAGNSGGALLNSSGAVIGINSAKYSDTGVEGMGYAIPMSDAWSIIEALIAGEDIPQSAYLGISGQSVSTDVASVYGVPEGVLVVEVFEGTAADNAGILSGDIITKFEGEELTSMDELKTALAAYKEGDIVTLTVAHKSQGYAETEVTVTLGASTSGD
ncbi:MAG: trypsin-like peptidase domain-containing protein, partial [Clostridiales bacterium]|nr:trypsin-like peptidase domain-containing protein [Clostridiales bacterium]